MEAGLGRVRGVGTDGEGSGNHAAPLTEVKLHHEVDAQWDGTKFMVLQHIHRTKVLLSPDDRRINDPRIVFPNARCPGLEFKNAKSPPVR
jgi:hypothetical protein